MNIKHHTIGMGIGHLVVYLFALIVAYPFIWMVMQSFKTSPEMYASMWALPKQLLLKNYVDAWRIARLGRYIWNSLFVSSSTVITILIVASTASFALSKIKFPGYQLFYYMFIFSLILPVPIIPLYYVVSSLGLINSYFALILPYTAGGLPLSIFLLKSFFDGIPDELYEAATIDGCKKGRLYLVIMLPLARAGLSTVAIFQFMGAWNEFLQALIFIRKSSLKTIPVGINALFEIHSGRWPMLFAALSITTIPVFVVYYLMQRQFMEGLTSGAVKQ